MGLLSKISSGTRELHRKTENMPFLVRYRSAENLEILDHYRMLSQFIGIYQVLEQKIQDMSALSCLYDNFTELTCRSKRIQADQLFYRTYITDDDSHEKLLASTTEYIAYLNALDPEKDQDAIIGHFLVRILGDLFGGQSLKEYVQAMLGNKNISSEEGTEFYRFSNGMLKNFSQGWLNQQHDFLDEDNVVRYANDAFQYHINVFTEMENTRKIPRKTMPISYKAGFCVGLMFFTAAAATTACAVTTCLSSKLE